MLSPNKCLPEATMAKGKPAHPALLALLCSAALVLGASTVSLVRRSAPPQPLTGAWQMEKVGASFPPQWLPVLLGVHGTASSLKATGRVLAHLAMLSTASGWVIPSEGEAHDSPLSSHEATITDGVDSARDRRRLASSCDGSCDFYDFSCDSICNFGCSACPYGKYSAASTSEFRVQSLFGSNTAQARHSWPHAPYSRGAKQPSTRITGFRATTRHHTPSCM
eukprot:scaffold6712_cov67-Phaeocystis_antarctica.AAC.3